MIDRDRQKTILRLAAPIVGGMISGNLLSLVDTAMVGTLGNAALAGVGMSGAALAFGMSVVFGLSSGVQAMVSRRHGEGDTEGEYGPLNAGLWAAFMIGAPASVIFFMLAPMFFGLAGGDPDMQREGAPYLQALFAGLVPLGLNYAFRGYWNGIGKPKFYMVTLMTTHFFNIVLNYVLIFGKLGVPALGTLGAGIASTLSLWIGTITYYFLVRRHGTGRGFLKKPSVNYIKRLLGLSIPTGTQNLFGAASGVVLYGILAQIGTAEMAAGNVLLKMFRVLLFPAIGLGFAGTTLVGRSMGRKEPRQAARWGWDAALLGFLMPAVLGMPLIIFPEPILSIFIMDPHALSIGILPARLLGLTIGIEGAKLVLMYALLGSGDNKRVMFSTVFFTWFFFLPGAWLAGLVWDFGLVGVFLAQMGSGILLAATFSLRWSRGEWQKISV